VTSRRSRSPDYVRGFDRGVPRGGSQVARGGYDRYESRPVNDLQHGDFRGQKRVRDDYRPGRSPTPPQVAGFKRRDGYAPNSGRDYYDGRGRERSRSRSPIKWRDNGRYRDRSPSPIGRNSYGEAEPPQRDARDVPEVQIVLIDELDRGFVTWVEGEFRAKSIKTDVMIMSPRLSLAAIIRQQIVEGVLAVTQLSRRSQDTSKVPLQVFDRKGGANNVRFDEYQDLEPKIAAELVIRAKQAQGPPPQTYVQPQFIPPQAYQAPPPVAAAPNLASLVGTLDNASLQQLLGTLNASGQQQQAAAQANSSIDLAGILGGLSQQIQQQNQQQNYSAPPAQNNNYNAMTSTQSLASLLGNGQGQPQQQSAQQVQDIMAQLARFRQ
jgi:nuclear polyadenylated RNA-binding protein 3